MCFKRKLVFENGNSLDVYFLFRDICFIIYVILLSFVLTFKNRNSIIVGVQTIIGGVQYFKLRSKNEAFKQFNYA